MNQSLPFSAACERNKDPILGVLRTAFAQIATVLEIGSGTGQHAVHFARHLAHITWQPTDRAEWLAGLRARVAAEGAEHLLAPLELDVAKKNWVAGRFDAVFTANTFHIMSWPEVQAFFRGLDRVLEGRGLLAVYGPFNYDGAYTSESNSAFDAQLRERDPASGLRDRGKVDELAAAQGLDLVADHAMPANNRLVLWQRR